MSEQSEFRMPSTGEAWRHCKGGLYTIIGMSRDDEGEAVVVYTNYNWTLSQLAPIYNQPLGRFLHEVENGKPRFRFDREPETGNRCQYIDPTVMARVAR